MVQQRQGRAQPTLNVDGKSVNDNPGQEHEADVMGTQGLTARPRAALRAGGVALFKLSRDRGRGLSPHQQALAKGWPRVSCFAASPPRHIARAHIGCVSQRVHCEHHTFR